ncbi:MAG: alanine--tRNA ligase [Gammaproteobacteria bacterium]|nr:alanine--tRNA ligase [Gammaproteobacteria bacterium]
MAASENFKTAAQVRQAFLDYFHSKGHEILASSPLVPANDPTLLFTNAGMVQFKDVFLGNEQRPYSTATTSQRCVRAGGKHNDLENVGYTARHHTFFEMLGNFSFGDYFKKEAIEYAWDFLTNVIGLPEEKLWVTVFNEDKDAEGIWLNDVKVSPERFSRIGAKDNFWSMGDTGPCGPCTEIFYDHGEDVAGGPPGSPDEDGDRYIEIWNLVFMQYDRDKSGKLTDLPKPSVDTGMGLERLTAILQNVHNNYDIDLFQALIKDAAKIADCKDLENKSLRVIADHIRASTFLVVDGVIPSNEGRGYVLRRIIRRAIRHGHKLGIRDMFFSKLVASLSKVMGDAYPELIEKQQQVEKVLLQEEERFAETLEQGMEILESEIQSLTNDIIPGTVAFKLYDTYGFPLDLTADIARERNLQLDQAGFDIAMEEQRNRARAAGGFSAEEKANFNFSEQTSEVTEFCGYANLSQDSKITDIFVDHQSVQQIKPGDEAIVVMSSTPFYAESGGQVGDFGQLIAENGDNPIVFDVLDTQKNGKKFLHIGKLLSGTLAIGQTIDAKVNAHTRQATASNHSATHLLHAALRQVLGQHVQQKGSLVDAQKLRFDFSHFEAITNEQITEIERLVNTQIRANHEVKTQVMDIDEAKNSGAMALFGEKYDDKVRVLSMSEFSIELCGGTHVSRTGDIGLFKIISESGVAAGVRRIEAVTAEVALESIEQQDAARQNIILLLKAQPHNIEAKISQLLEQNKQLEKECAQLKSKLASSQGGDLANNAVEIAGIKLLSVKLDGVDPKSMRETVDQLKNKLGSCVVVLGTASDNKVNLIAGVSKDLTSKIKAGDVVNFVAQQVGGKGGGRPDMAMAGGSQPENLNAAINSVQDWIKTQI